MVKGMTRRIVEIRETGSDYFEKAIFFVRMDTAGNVAEYTLTQEAGKIIDRLCADLSLKKRAPHARFWSVARLTSAALLGAAAGILLFRIL